MRQDWDCIVPVILCGGSGTRLWPLSRSTYPKQLLRLIGKRTMVQGTAQRFAGSDYESPILICNEEHRFIIAEQLRQVSIKPERLVLEPVGRNTAPAAAVAALILLEEAKNPLMLISPADHLIMDEPSLCNSVKASAMLASAGYFVTFGVVPTRPETGYGYIKKGKKLIKGEGYQVERFVEKPDMHTAKEYINSGNHLWNSGMFLISAKEYLKEFGRLHPKTLQLCEFAVASAIQEHDFLRLESKSFSQIESNSIDYAVMENCKNAAVIPINIGWSDVGSWQALWESAERDENGNVTDGDVVASDCQNSYLRTDGPLLAALGLKDLAVVATNDSILVTTKKQAEGVRGIVKSLMDDGRSEVVKHPRIVRPWGAFEELRHEKGYQVKLLTINPGACISLQYHNKRSEHWVVVEGVARVTRNDKIFDLRVNQSTFIDAGVHHRLENPGDVPLQVIEVQSGKYLGEDDIIRLEDLYGRA